VGRLKTPYPPNQGLKLGFNHVGTAGTHSLKPLIHQTKDWNMISVARYRQTPALKTPYPPNQGLKHFTVPEGDVKTVALKPLIHQTKDWNMKLYNVPPEECVLKPLIHQTKDWNTQYFPTSTKCRLLKTPYPPNQGLKRCEWRGGGAGADRLKPLIHQTKDWNK